MIPDIHYNCARERQDAYHLAGHRTTDEHDCFAMRCAGLQGDVERLQAQLLRADAKAVHGDDPLRVFGHAVGIALAERKVPDEWDAASLTPAQVLEATATLLDRIDDATDAYLAAKGAADPMVGRSMQRDLRALIDAVHGDGLDAAWAEAEAALPEGWYIGALTYRQWDAKDPRPWLAQAYEPTERMAFNSGFGPTPAEALRALAAALRGDNP